MDDQRKVHPDPERPLKKSCSQQLLIHNMPTVDVENTNGKNEGDLGFDIKDTAREQEEQEIYIDQHIHKDSQTRRKNAAMLWVDNKKAYDMVSQSWIINCL